MYKVVSPTILLMLTRRMKEAELTKELTKIHPLDTKFHIFFYYYYYLT